MNSSHVQAIKNARFSVSASTTSAKSRDQSRHHASTVSSQRQQAPPSPQIGPQSFDRSRLQKARDSVPLTLTERHRTLRYSSFDWESESELARIIFHPRFETFGGCVVLLNFLVMTLETQASATSDDNLQDFVFVANKILLVYYTAETVARLYVTRRGFFRAGWNNLDFFIVITGLLSEVLAAFKFGSSRMDQVAMLKSLRLLRLLRLVRLLVAFRELYVLVAGIGRCMKTLFWAAGLIFVVLNVWAIISVELLDARVKVLHSAGKYGTCNWCAEAFANVWYANLTWFQIISTADWSVIGRPLTERYYWPYIIFILNIFVVMWGLLNLIVAAIVDSNIAAREDDVAIASRIAEQARDDAWQSFNQLCKEMDEDSSGHISVPEFKKFWKSNHELQQHLTIMGVQERDIDELLGLMDRDGSGMLDAQEFVEEFTAMRTLVEKTTLYYLLKFVSDLRAEVAHQSQFIRSITSDMASLRMSRSNLESRDAFATDASDRNSCLSSLGAEANIAETSTPKALDTGLKTLPPGWYYFGMSLPLEASRWCKAIDPVGHNGSEQTKEVTVTADTQKWEPVELSGLSMEEYPNQQEPLLQSSVPGKSTRNQIDPAPRSVPIEGNQIGRTRFSNVDPSSQEGHRGSGHGQRNVLDCCPRSSLKATMSALEPDGDHLSPENLVVAREQGHKIYERV